MLGLSAGNVVVIVIVIVAVAMTVIMTVLVQNLHLDEVENQAHDTDG